MDDLFPRAALLPLLSLLEASPAVLVHGPRGSGKRTLVGLATDGRDYEIVDLEDPAFRNAAAADPAGFVWDLPPFVILEEIQRVPALLGVIAVEAVRDPVPGRFIATSALDTQPDGSVPPGIDLFRLDPMSQSEFGEWNSGFLECLFACGFEPGASERLGFELVERIVDGGFPEAVSLATPDARAAWYLGHVQHVVERDIHADSRLRSPRVLTEVLTGVAAVTGDLLNTTHLALPSGLSRPTVQDYVNRLARAHLVDLIPAWEAPARYRLVVTPRVHVIDTGIGAALQSLTADDVARDRSSLAALLRTFTFQELRRQAAGFAEPCWFTHLRDRDGGNVDVVIERADGVVAGVTTRTGGTVTAQDFRGLRKVRRAAGTLFAAGVVLYDGESTLSFGDGLFAVPIRLLWELA